MKTARFVRRKAARCLAVLSASLAGPAMAQEALNQIVPSVSLTETLTDNVGLTGSGNAKSDLITTLSPSVSATAKGGRVEGNLQATFNSSHYASDTDLNRNFLTMRGQGRIEAWEKRGFVDLSVSESREVLSVLGPRPADNVTGNANLGQVRNFVVSPYLTGRFGSTGKADLRYSYSATTTDSSVFQSTQSNVVSLSLTDPRAFGNLGWSVVVLDSNTQTTNRRDLINQNGRATALYQVDPQLQLRLIVGSEKNNYMSGKDTTATILGAGADWTISPLTKLSGTWEDRFFGPGYLFSGEHRRGSFLFTVTYSKDASNISQALDANLAFSRFDLMMGSLAFVKDYPNETLRAAAVRQYIAVNQLPDTVLLNSAVLSNGIFLDRRLRLGVTLIRERNSLLLSATRSERNNLSDQSFSLGGDFQQATRVNESGIAVIGSHQLTPITSASLGLTFVRGERSSTLTSVSQTTRSRTLNLMLSTRLTPKVNGSLNFRNNQSEGTTSYTENAMVGSLAVRF